MLTENQITDILADYFAKMKFKIHQKLSSKQKGIDLIVENLQGEKLYIEIKGDTSGKPNSKRFGMAFTQAQIWTHVSVALMKTVSTINNESYKGLYGIAVPASHLKLIKSIKPSLDKLKITVYIVSGVKVEVLK